MGMEIRRRNQIQDIRIRIHIHSKDHGLVILRTGVQRNSEWVWGDIRHNHNRMDQHTDQQTVQPDMVVESAHHTVYAVPAHKPEVAVGKDYTDWQRMVCRHGEQMDGMDTDGGTEPEHNPLVLLQQRLSLPLPILPDH
jgi:hypothetical protein